jgi:putative peptidoglycan lipid II flippase
MNLLFIGPFKHAGLALAIGLGACMNAGLLYYYLRKANVYKPQPGWFFFMTKLAIAVGTMAMTLHFAAGSNDVWMAYQLIPKLIHLSALLFIGVITYFAVLWLLGLRVKDFMQRTDR